jgi:hypothetical protein
MISIVIFDSGKMLLLDGPIAKLTEQYLPALAASSQTHSYQQCKKIEI